VWLGLGSATDVDPSTPCVRRRAFPDGKYLVREGTLILGGTDELVSDLVDDLKANIVLLGIAGPGRLTEPSYPLPPPGIDNVSNLVSMETIRKIRDNLLVPDQVSEPLPDKDRAEARREPYRMNAEQIREITGNERFVLTSDGPVYGLYRDQRQKCSTSPTGEVDARLYSPEKINFGLYRNDCDSDSDVDLVPSPEPELTDYGDVSIDGG